MATSLRPDIVVGIDVGQTCSGVAYSIGPDWHQPHTINHWPGFMGDVKADKVATRVGYIKGTNSVQSWGFECQFGDHKLDIREQFKLTLDHEYQDDRGFDCHQARRWYGDYLRCLYDEIVKFLDSHVPNWENLRVEYNFSTPTTWRNPAMVDKIENIIKSSGFESTPNQVVRMGLTEAEAAAIDASKTRYSVGDVFLICDAGGGTTDVNLLQVKSIENSIELEPLDHVEGVSVGSTLIDYQITQHIVQRLGLIEAYLEGDLYCLAEEMLTGKFQTIKHSFPKPVVDQYWLEVKGLAGSHSFPEAGIVNSKMSIERETLQAIFDRQISQIFTMIDERLVGLQDEHPHLQVSYIILSGGLGSSPYLYDQLKRRYEMNVGFSSHNTASMRIMKVLEPQLSVVRGLVRERTQQLGTISNAGKPVFHTRRCRNSYGTVVREVYSVARHGHLGNSAVFKNHDGRLWVEGCIDWFIVQGQPVDVASGISKPYACQLAKDDLDKTRSVRIVMSTLPVDRLPRRTGDYGCQDVVFVKYKLTTNDVHPSQIWAPKGWKLKTMKLRKKHLKAEFAFVVKLGPADLRFQIVGSNGVLSSDHESLQVDFIDTSELNTPRHLRHPVDDLILPKAE